MTERAYLPESTRVSVLTAAVLLAFAMTRIISAPHIDVSLPLVGIVLGFTINLNLVIVILTAGLTATGMDWLLRTHPSLEKGETREHWLLPTLTVLVIGIALNTLPKTAVWWLGFGVGGGPAAGGVPGRVRGGEPHGYTLSAGDRHPDHSGLCHFFSSWQRPSKPRMRVWSWWYRPCS